MHTKQTLFIHPVCHREPVRFHREFMESIYRVFMGIFSVNGFIRVKIDGVFAINRDALVFEADQVHLYTGQVGIKKCLVFNDL